MATEKQYLLSTLWNQYGKVVGCGSNENLEDGINFNQYVPLDLYVSGDVRSCTGCATTAAAQIIYYYVQSDFGDDEVCYDIKLDVLAEKDAYVSHANIPALTVYISADGGGDAQTLSFDEIRHKLSAFVPAPADPEDGNYDADSRAAADYIAALNFTVGVLHHSSYSDIFGTEATMSADVFLRCGFESAYYVDWTEMDDAEQSLWLTENEQLTDEAIEILIENLENGSPVMFGITGHGVVLDGYDRETDMFHLNYGWGPEEAEGSSGQENCSTRWYTRKEFKELGTIGFVLDISPVFQETFTVTDSRVLGSGTLLRVVQQANAMQGANGIVFNDQAKANALELPVTLELKDRITVDGFNMTVFVTKKDVAAGGTAKKSANEDVNEEDADSTATVFYGSNGNRTDFTDFRGNIICKYSTKSVGAALDFSEAVQLNFSARNANIFAGIYKSKNSVILGNMESGSLKKLLANCQKKVAIAGSDGDDRIILDEKTMIIGNFELDAGHDSLTVTGNSSVYGDIDAGRGDDVITISAGSSVHGNLTGEAELCMTLAGLNTSVLFDITGDADSTFENIISITIDAAAAEAEEYTLFNKGNIENLLDKLHIKGGGGIIAASDGSIKWSAAGSYVPSEKEEEDPEIISDGQTAANATVGADELWIFQSGSKATGSLHIAEGGEVKVMTGAEFIFDISSISEENPGGIINNYSGINGTFHFSIQVAADQACGSYILADNVAEWDFNTPIRVTAGDIELGAFEGDKKASAFTRGDKHYALVYDENKKALTLVIDSAFRTTVNDGASVGLSWHTPAGATEYFLNISRSDEAGAIHIYSQTNEVNIVTAAAGQYEWQVIAPGLETEYRDGGTFSFGDQQENPPGNAFSTLYNAGENDDVSDVFMAKSSGTWGHGYAAQHAELPKNWNGNKALCAQVDLKGKNRYTDIFQGAGNDTAQLYLSDSENGDALCIDDIYSAFPDKTQCERITDISTIYAGNGNDIIDLTTDKFASPQKSVTVYGGAGDDIIWASSGMEGCLLYGDEGNDCCIGSSNADCLIGGAGDDIMHGGGGEDVFAYGDPATWGNDIVYQLLGEKDSIEFCFEQKDLEGKILEESIEGGVRFSVEGYENSSITFYGKYYSLVFGDGCNKLLTILEGGGCGEFASQNIFEDQNKGMLA